ncbi:MAG TPA: hypothetical protein PK411_14865 [Mesotoga infera]|nr:hypothetical protein [Mesotoga infera]HRV02866.1 hypothetical protein [Mesotoga sp.]
MRIMKSKIWESFEVARDNNVWANKKKHFSKWEVGERVVMFIEEDGVALGEITGLPFYSEEVLWEDDLYPWRIPISFELIAKGKEGETAQRRLKRIIAEGYGSYYGSLILFGIKIPEVLENDILEFFSNK